MWDEPRTASRCWRSCTARAPAGRERRRCASSSRARSSAASRAAVEADRPALRANLVASQVMGLVAARYVARIEPLASLDADEVVPLVAPTLQRYLDGTLEGRGCRFPRRYRRKEPADAPRTASAALPRRAVLADVIPGARVRDVMLVISGALLTALFAQIEIKVAGVAGADHRPDARRRPGGRDARRCGAAWRRWRCTRCSACSCRSTPTASRAGT